MSVEEQIQELVDRETLAWNARDAEALVDLFHPDMVWPWPPSSDSHDPINWVFPQGRFNRERWTTEWNRLFAEYELLHNHRRTVRIVASAERDGGFAVVDVDTLWKHRKTGEHFHWKGRSCKGYTFVKGEWKLVFHTGLLDYSSSAGASPRRKSTKKREARMRSKKPGSARPKTIDDYLAPLSSDKRAALERLRRDIRAAAPDAEEAISYGIPAFRLGGKMLVAFGAAAKHCALYPGAHPVEAHEEELEGYDTSKGTVRFPVNRPLPAALVRKLVRTRIAEYAGPTKAGAGRDRRGRHAPRK